jgi:hypothetical protein
VDHEGGDVGEQRAGEGSGPVVGVETERGGAVVHDRGAEGAAVGESGVVDLERAHEGRGRVPGAGVDGPDDVGGRLADGWLSSGRVVHLRAHWSCSKGDGVENESLGISRHGSHRETVKLIIAHSGAGSADRARAVESYGPSGVGATAGPAVAWRP